MFETLKPLPPDAILGIMALFRADPHAGKIDLSVGVYQDEQGRTPVLGSVKLAEKAILDAYLPSQMDAAQLEQAIRSLSQELGTTQIGPLMAALRQRHAGNYDGKLASELIKKLAV